MITPSPTNIVKEIFFATLKSADPFAAVKKYTGEVRRLYKEAPFGRLAVAGFGKAACAMARALEEEMGNSISGGVIVTKYGHCLDTFRKMEVFEAGHPVPDENGLHRIVL